jgi:predicted alpha/beta superfamily hydrolase
MRRRGNLAVVGLVLVVALSGCGMLSGDGGGTPTPAETTAGPGSTPAETAPADESTAMETTAAETTAAETQTTEDSEAVTTETASAEPELPEASPPTDIEVDTRASEWADDRPVTGNVTRLNVTIPQLGGRERGVWVYVPPSYDEGEQSYPVVYMQDGQNVFDDAVSLDTEWRVDETMERLAEEEGLEAIVVATENAGTFDTRADEYLPWESQFEDYGGNGTAYAAFLAETLKPTIDQRYRTQPNETVVMGSSYGGVASIYAGFAYPEQFQYVGGMSNAHMGVPEIYDFLNESGPGPERVYVDWGTEELNFEQQFIDVNTRLVSVLEAMGYERGETLIAVEEEGGQHNESAWQERFPRAIRYLLTGDDPGA